MTEAEAKTKWCPFVRHSTQNPTNGGADPGINRYSSGAVDYKIDDGVANDVAWNKCIGSACMAWRYTNKTGLHDRRRWIDAPDRTADEAHAEYMRDFALEGRCGLAGS